MALSAEQSEEVQRMISMALTNNEVRVKEFVIEEVRQQKDATELNLGSLIEGGQTLLRELGLAKP